MRRRGHLSHQQPLLHGSNVYNGPWPCDRHVHTVKNTLSTSAAVSQMQSKNQVNIILISDVVRPAIRAGGLLAIHCV